MSLFLTSVTAKRSIHGKLYPFAKDMLLNEHLVIAYDGAEIEYEGVQRNVKERWYLSASSLFNLSYPDAQLSIPISSYDGRGLSGSISIPSTAVVWAYDEGDGSIWYIERNGALTEVESSSTLSAIIASSVRLSTATHRVNISSQAPIITDGAITAGTASSLTTDTPLTKDALVGKVVVVTASDGRKDVDYVISNTTDTITFPRDMEFTIDSSCTFSVIFTVAPSVSLFGSIIACDVTSGDMAFILPKVSATHEGSIFRNYIEVASNGNKVYNLCYNGDVQRGAKWGELVAAFEGVSLMVHTNGIAHYDIVGTENLSVSGAAYLSAPVEQPIAEEYTEVTTTWVTGDNRRFRMRSDGGGGRLEYTSLIPRKVVARCSLNISVPSAGTYTLAFRRDRGGVVTDYTETMAIAKSTKAIDILNLYVEVLLDVEYGDWLVPVVTATTAYTPVVCSVIIR